MKLFSQLWSSHMCPDTVNSNSPNSNENITFFCFINTTLHAIICGMCLYLLYSNSYKFDFPNSQISTKPCQRWLVPVLCSSLGVCLLCLIGLQYLLAPVNNNSQLDEWQHRSDLKELPVFRTTLFSVESSADSLGMLQCGWAAHSRSTHQCPRYSLVVSDRKKIKFFPSLRLKFVMWSAKKKKWFILKAL